jgi:wobble nucleotide-excising tRNase
VLSHEAGFLKGIRTGVRDEDVKSLQLRPIGDDNTVIAEWDIEAATQSAYLCHFRTLLAFRDERTGTPLDVAKAIRPFLEELYRVRSPGLFLATDSLGDFVVKAQDAASNGMLQINQSELQELENLNQYSRQFHHGQSPAISADELHGWVRRTLKLVGGC